MMINTVIIEDIPDNREALKKLLAAECPQVNIIGEADNVEGGYNLIKQLQPRLVFQDIELTDGTGFDILNRLHEEDAIDFEVIFFTAHGSFENARKAIAYSALDFITKPINSDDLKAAVSKAASKIDKEQYSAQIALLLKNLSMASNKNKSIAIHLIKGIIEFVEVDKIMYLEADGTMTKIFVNGNEKPFLATKNLGHYSKLLTSDYNFFPISNSLLINMDYVKQYNHRELTVSLNNGVHLFASRRGGQDFRRYLNDNKSRFGDLQNEGIGGLFKKLFKR